MSKSLNPIEYARRGRTIEEEISKIDRVIENADTAKMKELHIELDGKYQACICDWGKSMYAYNQQSGFYYENLKDVECLCHNLRMMRAKILSFKEGLNEKDIENTASQQEMTLNLTNNVSTNISVVCFQEALKKIEDMPGLSTEDTETLQSKIKELEKISKENISKKKKWDKVKPILICAIEKGWDVALIFINLILQKQFGM